MKVWITINENTLRRSIGEGFVAIGLTRRASQEAVYSWNINNSDLESLQLTTFKATIEVEK